LSDLCRIAIVAALEREVRPLVKNWRVVEREHLGRRFRFFENGSTVVVCGGIGPEAARRATEAVIALYQPEEVLSVGFAGALDAYLKVGDIFAPSRIVDAKDGSRVETGIGRGVLLSLASVASVEQKARLAEAYGAQAVDMEAAAVARGAQAHGVRFSALKAISDESSFTMPPVERFIGSEGQFRAAAFFAFIALRPWLWLSVFQLARNSAKASAALCRELEQYGHQTKLRDSEPELHPIT